MDEKYIVRCKKCIVGATPECKGIGSVMSWLAIAVELPTGNQKIAYISKCINCSAVGMVKLTEKALELGIRTIDVWHMTEKSNALSFTLEQFQGEEKLRETTGYKPDKTVEPDREELSF